MLNKKLHAQFCFFDPSYNMQSRHNLLVPLLISILLQFYVEIKPQNFFLSTYAFNNLQYKN